MSGGDAAGLEKHPGRRRMLASSAFHRQRRRCVPVAHRGVETQKRHDQDEARIYFEGIRKLNRMNRPATPECFLCAFGQ